MDLAQKVTAYSFFPVYYNVTIIVKFIISGVEFIISLVLE